MSIADQMAADAATAPAQPPMSIAQQMAADSVRAAAPSAAPAPPSGSRWSRDVDANDAMGGAVLHLATGAAGSIVGGFRGLAALAFPESMGANPGESRTQTAARLVNEAQDQFTYNPDQATEPNAAAMVQAVNSKYSPLMIPAHVGNALGTAVNSAPNQIGGVDITAPKAGAAALADAVGQVFTPMLGVKAPGIAGAARSSLRGIMENARISPEEAANTANLVRQQATQIVQRATPQPLTAGAGPQPVGAQPAAPGTQASNPAAPVAPMPRAPTIADASPELQQAIVNKANAGESIDPAHVQRYVEADTLPVPIQLTKGQAMMDPATISNEMNSRGKSAPLVSPEFYNQQSKALGANLDAIRQQAAPDIPPSNPTEHGQTMVDEYKAMDAPVVADVSAKYKALEDANGGNFPIDGQQLAANTQAALDKALKSGSVPADLQANLDKFANGRQMTFQDFETMRSDAADAQRTAADGRQRAAAGIIRDQLEDMPLTPEAAALKPLADTARAAAKARFDAMDADPAYAASVSDGVPQGQPSPLADTFVQKYLIGAPRANVLNMRTNLANSQTAMQTIPAATLDYLKSSAKVDADSGKFAADSFNTTSKKLQPKYDALLDPQSAALVQQVGNVAKYTNAQPKGSFVNNSNTLVGAAGQVGLDFAKSVLAAKTAGLSNVAGSLINGSKAGASAKASIAPGAGIGTNLRGLMEPDQ